MQRYLGSVEFFVSSIVIGGQKETFDIVEGP